VVDQLLANYDENPAESDELVHSDSVFSANVEAELAQLAALRERGVISDEQYEDEKEQLLEAR
jgi:7-keto-8-aminopelargonate synthetase-like enzyme